MLFIRDEQIRKFGTCMKWKNNRVSVIKNFFLDDFFCYAMLVIAAIFLGLMFYFQPKIADDWYLIWDYQKSNNIIQYWFEFYNGWSGRLPLIIVTSLIILQPAFEIVYRVFILIEVLVLLGLAWYCALGLKGLNFSKGMRQPFFLFGMLLWLSLPARAETVSWISGNAVFLLPCILGLNFIAWSRYFINDELGKSDNPINLAKLAIRFIFYFFVGFLAGASQEQIIFACLLFTILYLCRDGHLINLKFISINYWFLLAGFLTGMIFLISAPGNYLRLNVMEAPDVFELLKRMVLYIASAFFEIGTGDLGKPIWLGILLLFALFYGNQIDNKSNVGEGKMWLYISLATLLTLIPATNQISPRTTFSAVLFLYIAVASFLFKGTNLQKRPIVSMTMLVASLLVMVEAAVGLISNILIASEYNNRWALISANQSKQMIVPFIATIPSNLTYIQTPEQDREFLKALSAHVGFKVEHDTSEGAPLSASHQPLKAIKFQ